MNRMISILDLAARLGYLDLGAPRPPTLTGDGHTFNPTYDGGNPTFTVNGLPAGEGYVVVSSPDATTEDFVLRDSVTSSYGRYTNMAPRTPSSSADEITVAGAGSPFSTRAAFLSGVRSRLGLGSTEAATYSRAAIRRFRVLDVSDLAGSLTEITPKSRLLNRLTGVDANNNPVEGWVYVETPASTSGKVIRHIHQLVPASLILPPTGTVTLHVYNNPNDWDLSDWILAKAGVGGQYSRCVCWTSVVETTTELQEADQPSAAPAPDGVEAWS